MDNPTVCLIIPPSIFLLDERVFISLGILRVAASLEQSGFNVEMLDLSGIKNYCDAVSAHANNTVARQFGITATTPQMPAARQIARTIRYVRPDAKIILGGPHVTLTNAAMKKERIKGLKGRAHAATRPLKKFFDVLVAGDGEEAILSAVSPNSPKIIDADDPSSSMFLTNAKLNTLPLPARHLVDMASYRYEIDGLDATSIIAQLGCPFGCGFCGGRYSPTFRKIRKRSSENVIEELQHIYSIYGKRGFMFYDDELNVNMEMSALMNKIGDLQMLLGVEFRLRGFLKAELVTQEQATALYSAGFRWVLVGFESGSPQILKNINKKATLEQNTRCLDILRKHGLKVKALMSIGHPGETEETVAESMQWLERMAPDDFDITIITCYPGTPYYDRAVPTQKEGIWKYVYDKTGDVLYQEEVDYTKISNYYKGKPDGGYRSYVFTEGLSQNRIVELRDYLERELRAKLGIPFNPSASSIRFEHSMGQLGGPLPSSILKTSNGPP